MAPCMHIRTLNPVSKDYIVYKRKRRKRNTFSDRYKCLEISTIEITIVYVSQILTVLYKKKKDLFFIYRYMYI